jgi:hypothetical protein
VELIENGGRSRGNAGLPPLWDGQTAPRIVQILKSALQRDSNFAPEHVPVS